MNEAKNLARERELDEAMKLSDALEAAAVSYAELAGDIQPAMSKTPEPSTLASATGYAARLEQLKAELNERRLTEIAAMLDDAGVPAWVENRCHKGVPSNSAVMRLKWYLARRKNVKAAEIDQKLQREMKEAEIHAREYMGRYNDESSHGASKI
jgi:hypothetical protein